MPKFPIVAAVTRLARLPKSLLKPPPGYKKPQVKDLKKDMEKLGEAIAEEFKEKIIENIETNALGYSLAESTIRKKGHDTPFIDSHELVDAIYREGTTVSVENTPRDDSSLSNLELAMVLEYGTKDRHIPARPLWRTTFRDYKKVARKRIETYLKKQKLRNKAKLTENGNSTG